MKHNAASASLIPEEGLKHVPTKRQWSRDVHIMYI